MKIKTILIGICISVIFGIVVYINNNSNDMVNSTEYVLSDNSNNAFNETFSSNSHMQFGVPDGSPAIPLEGYNRLSSIEGINTVLPYYPLDIVTRENGNNTWHYWQDDINQKKSITMPIKTPYDSEMDLIQIKSVSNYDMFYNGLKSGAPKEPIIHEFNSDSGIYISSFIFDQLNLNENLDQLFIQLDVRVPVVATIETEREDGILSFQYQCYKPIEYSFIPVVLEVQGVIDGSSGGFCRGFNIIIPYDMSKEIIDSVDRTEYILEENQMYWEPNSYILICEEDISSDQLIQLLSTEINSFYLNEYDYGDIYTYPYSYLYVDGEIYKYKQ